MRSTIAEQSRSIASEFSSLKKLRSVVESRTRIRLEAHRLITAELCAAALRHKEQFRMLDRDRTADTERIRALERIAESNERRRSSLNGSENQASA
jgi:hypothetical protein